MKMKNLYEVTKGILIAFGIITLLFLEVLPFPLLFPVSPSSSDGAFASPVPFGMELW